MIDWFKNLGAYTVAAAAATGVSRWMGSTIVGEILIPNLMVIVIALLAINVQTTAVIAVKLRELADAHKISFKASVNQFRVALAEQTALVFLSCLLAAFAKTKVAMLNSPPWLFVEWGVYFVLIAAVHIFFDTSIGLLVALFPDED